MSAMWWGRAHIMYAQGNRGLEMAKRYEDINGKNVPQGRQTGNPLPPYKRTVVGDSISWALYNPDKIVGLISVVVKRGGAVRYGTTRDGDGYSIGVYLGENSKTYYANSSEELDDLMEYLHAYLSEGT